MSAVNPEAPACPNCTSLNTWESFEDPSAFFCGTCRGYFRQEGPSEAQKGP